MVSDAILDSMSDHAGDLEPDRVRPLRRAEFDELARQGVFDDENVELLYGTIVTMSPEGEVHVGVAHWLFKKLVRTFDDDELDIRHSAPLAASDESEPLPDILVCSSAGASIRADHPSDALLLVEVSKASIRKDRRLKARLYAEVGIPEYWVVDLTQGAPIVHVHTRPTATGYASVVTLRDGDVLRPVHVPIEIAVADVPR